MSKSSAIKTVNHPEQLLNDAAFELTAPVGTPAWKQQVNEKLAAHRTRRGGPQGASDQSPENQGSDGQSDGTQRSASSRAAEAAARVAARYAKAPSYKQLLAGEARAVVRAAGAAAEAARNAQAAAQAVLTGLEFGPDPGNSWEQQEQAPSQVLASPPAHPSSQLHSKPAAAQTAPARWQDEPPLKAQPTAAEIAWQEYEAIHGPQHMPKPRWEESLPVATAANSAGVGRDEWSEMRLSPAPEEAEQYRRARPDGNSYEVVRRDGELFHYESQDPIDEATVQPVQPIAANLIEFPRELIAARKVRPRQAEGPFYDTAKDSPQLSIFEVDPELLPPPIYLNDAAMDVTLPEWTSIQLDHRSGNRGESASTFSQEQDPARPYEFYTDHSRLEAAFHATDEEQWQPAAAVTVPPETLGDSYSTRHQNPASAPPKDSRAAAWESIVKLPSALNTVVDSPATAPLQVAPLSDRVLAAIVDGALVTMAFLAAATVVMASTDHPPAGRVALIAGACGLLLFGMIYQYLFFSFSEEGTPGMRYARVALCSFEDDNPSREQICKRIPALLLSAAPAGLGLAWAFVDGDSLALHDRLTRTYQRKY